jgi:ubiquitin-like protein Pup
VSNQEVEGQRRAERPEDVDTAAPTPATQERREALDADVDAILDEIDEILEENAEDFVKSFVQKGGQ